MAVSVSDRQPKVRKWPKYFNNVAENVLISPYNAKLFLYIPFEIYFSKIWNHLKCLSFLFSASFEYLCYGSTYRNYKYFYSYSAGIVFIRQNLTSTDVIFWRIKKIPALKGLSSNVGEMLLIQINLLSTCFGHAAASGPKNSRRPSDVLMLAQGRRRWASIKPAWVWHIVSAVGGGGRFTE